jgi:hypothetical protein
MLEDTFGNQIGSLIPNPMLAEKFGNQNHLISINNYGQKKQAESQKILPTSF